jgi:hypothetical protein
MSVEAIIEEARKLSRDELKELIKALIDIDSKPQPESPQKRRSLREFRGLGKEIWDGIDAQEYVNKLRSEWDDRP